MIRPIALGLAVVLGLSACTTREWKTAYTPVEPSLAANWTVRDVTVTAPDTLTTSELNTVEPDYDVIWHGEPRGDRRAQAAAIVTEGIRAGSAGLRGRQPVTISATISQFHAITPEAERLIDTFKDAGVDDIIYTIQVLDAQTGAAVTEPQEIQASFPATVASNRAEIVAHIAAVTRNWLGSGPDPRTDFTRIGR